MGSIIQTMASYIHSYNIGGDGFNSFNQELPLDLTVKKDGDDQNIVKLSNLKPVEIRSFNLENEYSCHSFETPSWYDIYISIANRQSQYQHQYLPSYGYHAAQIPSYHRDLLPFNGKRKESPNDTESRSKQRKSEDELNTTQLSEKVKSSGVWQPI